MSTPPALESLSGDRATLTSRALDALRAAIVDGRLEAGERYSVAQLAERFGVSRTPVREALLVLERQGVVRLERNLGVRVQSRRRTTSTDRPAAARAGGRGGDRLGWEESRS